MGAFLEDLGWQEAEALLRPETVVVIPIGAAAKEHGPHLKLSNDKLLAEHLTREVARKAQVVVAPLVPYHFYPAFVNYPGSTTLRVETARDTMVDICRSLAKFGPRRFYALNTGVSTVRALRPAAAELALEGIVLRFTDILSIMKPVEERVCRQEGGTHADEAETSMMLVIAPETVDMSRAVKDYHAKGEGPFTRIAGAPGTYSPTGSWGDPTLATREKGEALVGALVEGILKEIEELRASHG
ncbi:MAG TPA: creatininase family protein [Planctomycetota bacterium]|nr:creatininase family protein [Planctomycetota bacterium]